jgi:hypothetical protein
MSGKVLFIYLLSLIIRDKNERFLQVSVQGIMIIPGTRRARPNGPVMFFLLVKIRIDEKVVDSRLQYICTPIARVMVVT